MASASATAHTTEPSDDLDSDEEFSDVRSWMETLGGDQNLHVVVERRQPKIYKGHNVQGTVQTYYEPISEEDIREAHGGGVYLIRVKVPNEGGQAGMKYHRSRTIKIAGPPKVDQYEEHVVEAANPGLAAQAFANMERLTLDAQARADEARSSSPLTAEILQLANAPLLAQVENMKQQAQELRDALSSKDDRIISLISQRPDTSVQDRILERMVEGEAVRVDSLRAQHASELRALKEAAIENERRVREQALEDQRSRERCHEREVDNLTHQSEREIDTLKQLQHAQSEAVRLSYETRIDALKMDLDRQQRELVDARAELGELRARKDMSLQEKTREVLAAREAMVAMFPEQQQQSGWASVLSQVLDSPTLARIVADGPPQAEAVRQPPRIVPDPTPRRAAPAPTVIDVVTDEDIAQAVGFMEQALRNGTPPEVFAASARSILPGPMLASIRERGLESFLQGAVAEGSTLSTQNGKNYVRKVGKALFMQ